MNSCLKSSLVLSLACALNFASAATFTAKVVGVTDGDTVTVLDKTQHEYKIRLSGIDAPEKKQAFGMRSKQSLSDLVFDQIVTVEVEKHDLYGRGIGKILIGNQDVNLTQVSRGFAWHYKQYQKEQTGSDRKLYSFAEQDARTAKRGLWNDAAPMPPWEYRHDKR